MRQKVFEDFKGGNQFFFYTNNMKDIIPSKLFLYQS